VSSLGLSAHYSDRSLGLSKSGNGENYMTRLFRAPILLLAVLAAVLVPADAASASVVDNGVLDAWYSSGSVWAVDLSGDVVYFGGDFKAAKSPDGARKGRGNVAAISRQSGELLQAFDVETDGLVRAIESDGETVWIAGDFTTVNGQYRPYLAAVDARTGEIDSNFSAAPNKPVYAIDHAGGRLYVSGSFFRMNGSRMRRVASLDPVTGAPDYGFAAESDSIVRTVELSNNGSFLLVGGGFQNIGNQPRRALAMLDPNTGAALPSNFPADLSPVLGVATNDDDSQIFAAFGGSEGGPLFGWNNRVGAFDTATSANQWWHRADGDVQAIGFHDGYVYFGFHDSFSSDESLRMLRATTTGAIDYSWLPTIDSRRGVLAIDVNSDGLAAGGKFKNINGTFQKGLALWVSSSVTAPDVVNPDLVPPSTPTGLTVTRNNGNVVKLQWNDDSTDDRFVAGYRVYRNGELLKETGYGAHPDWNPLPGASAVYEVRALDSGGNESVSASVTVDVP